MFRVAIVGRPNVGKSTLFNCLCGMRKAIVGDEPGITRDRIIETISWSGKRIEILDTGGLVPNDQDVIPAKILEQVRMIIGNMDVQMFSVPFCYNDQLSAVKYQVSCGKARGQRLIQAIYFMAA